LKIGAFSQNKTEIAAPLPPRNAAPSKVSSIRQDPYRVG
jgi:hypothetical protein